MNFIPHLAYDSVVFGFSGDKLKILIMEYHNTGLFALPGGFIRMTENLDDAVKRGLFERTGLKDIYLEQFYTFGSLERHQPQVMQTIITANGLPRTGHSWLLDRYVTVAYYALINYKLVVPRPDEISDSCTWYNLDALPTLILDHQHIVDKALHALRGNLDSHLVGLNLLPPVFTMNDLQKVYEVILGEKLHRGAFQRKMLSLGILERQAKKYSGGAHKAPYVYTFISANRH